MENRDKKTNKRSVDNSNRLLPQAVEMERAVLGALMIDDDAYGKVLRANGFLTRDPRVKERKKYGLKKARRAPQFSKR